MTIVSVRKKHTQIFVQNNQVGDQKIFQSPLLRCPTAWEAWKVLLPPESWISFLRTIYFAKKRFNYLLNSMQNACTSIKSSCIDNMKFVCQIQWFHKSIWTWTLMILFLMRDWRKTQTSLTSLNLGDLNYLKLQEGSHWPVLHVLVLDGLTGGDAVGYVEVDELCGQLNHRGQSVHNLGNEWKMKRPEVHNQEKRNEFKDQK